MKTLPTAVQALLAKRTFFACTLYSFALTSGTSLNYTTFDRSISYNGTIYLSSGQNGPLFERSAASGGQGTTCSWKLGLEVSNLQFDVMPNGATINGVPFLAACRNGVFDGATLTRYRAYMDPAAPTVCVGAIMLDLGRVAEIEAGRSYATFTVNDHRELLNVSLPRNLYQASCSNALYDASCGLTRSAWGVTGTVGTGSTISQVVASLPQATGYFDLGTLSFTSGANAGTSRSVKQYIHGSPIKLMSPFASAPAAGDAFTIFPGCSKNYQTCVSRFGNGSRFRGQPFIPDASTAS